MSQTRLGPLGQLKENLEKKKKRSEEEEVTKDNRKRKKNEETRKKNIQLRQFNFFSNKQSKKIRIQIPKKN